MTEIAAQQGDANVSDTPSGFVDLISRHLSQLRFKNLFLVVAALLLIDLAIPDFIPLIDELLLGILTMMFWSWRKPKREEKVIESENKPAQ